MLNGGICAICGGAIERSLEDDAFVPCDECRLFSVAALEKFPHLKTTQVMRGSLRVEGDEEEEGVEGTDLETEFMHYVNQDTYTQRGIEDKLHAQTHCGRATNQYEDLAPSHISLPSSPAVPLLTNGVSITTRGLDSDFVSKVDYPELAPGQTTILLRRGDSQPLYSPQKRARNPQARNDIFDARFDVENKRIEFLELRGSDQHMAWQNSLSGKDIGPSYDPGPTSSDSSQSS